MEQKFKGWSILVDADGCLTDGKKYVDHLGNRQMIAFHSRDSIACKALVEMGFQVIVVTMSTFEGITNYWKRHGAHTVIAWGRDKITALEHCGIIWEKTIGIGDDITDDCFLEKCEFPYLVYDCNTYYEDNKYGDYKYPRFKTWGGDGVLSELVDKINKNTLYAEH